MPFIIFFRRILLLVILPTGLLAAEAQKPFDKNKPFRVVIDPGHGGSDRGTVYRVNHLHQITEKEVTLGLALEAARQLENHGYEVFLTRRTDQDLPLQARTALANKIKANLFISIHMNSHPGYRGARAEGIETYILNNATDETSKRLAYIENQSAHHQAISDVDLILKDLTLDANLSESKRLACTVQSNLVSVTSQTSVKPASQRNRGVKQALFFVLLRADMPSILVEAGFLNHPRDRSLVTSVHGKRAIGAALVRAIQQFRKDKGTASAQLELSRCKVH